MTTVLPSCAGEVAQRLAHGDHAARIETIGRLVEQQQVGIGEHRRRDPKTLLHAQ